MKAKPQFASIFLAVCIPVFLTPPAFAHPANPSQDQGTAQTQSGPQDKTQQDKTQQDKQKAGPGKEVGNGGEDVGKGTAKGAGSLGKGTAGAAGNLATLHPGKAGEDLGKGAAGAGKDVGVGAGKGAGKIGKGSGKGIGKAFGKIFHRGNKNKEPESEQQQSGR
jgi:hypothetical protein